MGRPKIRIAKEPLDHALEKAALLLLLITIVLTAVYYGRLPETIPIHYNTSGDPDGFGQKTTLLVISGISLLLFGGLHYLGRFPESFNYPVKITSENAETQYRAGLRLLRIVQLACMGLFAYITFGTIQTALGHWNGIGRGIFWSITLGVGALIWYSIHQSRPKQKTKPYK